MDLKSLRHYADSIKTSDSFVNRRIVARVAGVTFENRQTLLEKVSRSTPIKLERERRNEYDFHAVKVLGKIDNRWQQLGYLPMAMASSVANKMDEGVKYSAGVVNVKGGGTHFETGEKMNLGLDIYLKSE
jgi:single-stranded-DNA-specific exonuclease